MNTDQKQRDTIMGLDYQKYIGGLEKFEDLKVDQLEALVKENFVDPTYKYRSAPTIQAFLDFMKAHEGVLAHGFAITTNREDARVVIEGLMFYGKSTDELKKKFEQFCSGASDLRIEKDELYSWWG